MIASLDVFKSEERLFDLINVLSGTRIKRDIVVAALQNLANSNNAPVAIAARKALDALGVTTAQDDEKASVQKLVSQWKDDDGYSTWLSKARPALISFPNPVIVCRVLTNTMLQTLQGEPTTISSSIWIVNSAELLGEIGDTRFLDDLMRLYEAFLANPNWKHLAACFP